MLFSNLVYKCVLALALLSSSIKCLPILNITIGPENVVRDEDLIDCYERSDPTLGGEVQNVHMTITILDIDQINEKHMDFRVHCYVTLHWENKRIRMEVENHTRPIVVPRKLRNCMWQPDVIFPNTKDITSFHDMVPNVGYKYFPNGIFYRMERFMMTVECPMMFNLYPMDTQQCFLKTSLLTSPDDLVKISWRKLSEKDEGVFFAYEIQPLQFHAEKPRAHSVTLSWYTGNYTELWCNITFHRRMTGSVVNFYIPSTLVVLLTWISFYIDVEAAPARVSLGVTALLTIVTQTVQARSILPPVQYITSLDVWLFACLSLVFASFIEYSVAYSYRFKYPCRNRVVSTKSSKIWASKENLKAAPVKEVIFKEGSANVFDKQSRRIFPAIMLTFTITYWIYMFNATAIFSST